jgi:hypothetical protein
MFEWEDFRKLLRRHGVMGPVLCASIIGASVYGAVFSIGQIRKEWGILKKNSRQDWKKRIAPDTAPPM